jgi:hypothetical protein
VSSQFVVVYFSFSACTDWYSGSRFVVYPFPEAKWVLKHPVKYCDI